MNTLEQIEILTGGVFEPKVTFVRRQHRARTPSQHTRTPTGTSFDRLMTWLEFNQDRIRLSDIRGSKTGWIEITLDVW